MWCRAAEASSAWAQGVADLGEEFDLARAALFLGRWLHLVVGLTTTEQHSAMMMKSTIAVMARPTCTGESPRSDPMLSRFGWPKTAAMIGITTTGSLKKA